MCEKQRRVYICVSEGVPLRREPLQTPCLKQAPTECREPDTISEPSPSETPWQDMGFSARELRKAGIQILDRLGEKPVDYR